MIKYLALKIKVFCTFQIRMKLMLPVRETQNVSEEIQTGIQYVFVNNRPIKHKDLEKVQILCFYMLQLCRGTKKISVHF